ncbi:MAG TPA: autotransporter-associated beta strand repeat-containing protein [Chthoniobacterales bacterium]
MTFNCRPFLIVAAGLGFTASSRAEYLFGPEYLPVLAKYNLLDSNNNPPPAYTSWKGEFAEWNVLYSPHTAANYPDVTAPHGGKLENGVWKPVQASVAGFPTGSKNDPVRPYDPGNPLAFWDTKNPTITQTGTTSAFITGTDSSGNIYSHAAPTSFVLKDSTADASSPYLAKTVMFQFQTDGALVDFSNIRLRYTDGTGTHTLAATDYLREFQASTVSIPEAVGSIKNRVALQWDLSALSISSYEIVWAASASSMSFQRARLDTADHYADDAGLPTARTWTAPSGVWSAGANWAQGSTSNEGGNVRFANATAATATLDSNRTVGEMIFQTAANVTITPSASQKILSNTGITTTSAATGVYAVNAGWQLGALNLFDLSAGTVRLGGGVSGGYGFIKQGAGTLSLGGPLDFSGGVTVGAGTVEIASGGTYTGSGGWQVNSGAKLRVNGSFGGAGALTLTAATLGGAGTVSKSVTIASGSRLAPGVNAGMLTLVGSQTWSAGGGYEWQVANASQSSGWDFVQINGTLTLSGQFTIYATSITVDGILAAASGFDASQSYQWLIATASGGITGFSATNFVVNTSGFTNANGTFSVSRTGNSLFLDYTAVPEPGTWALLGLAGIALGGVACARRKAIQRQGIASCR